MVINQLVLIHDHPEFEVTSSKEELIMHNVIKLNAPRLCVICLRTIHLSSFELVTSFMPGCTCRYMSYLLPPVCQSCWIIEPIHLYL